MDFNSASDYLIKVFNDNDFNARATNRRYHSVRYPLESFANNSEITVCFPGYKSKVNQHKTVYDYRVDLTKGHITTALSHANIITDIYNKIVFGGMCPDRLKDVLIEVTKQGKVNIAAVTASLPYNSSPPTQVLIDYVHNAHGAKSYNKDGNSFDLTISELLASIKWIVLQEDINYPIAQGYEGRKMPLARYIEAIFATQQDTHQLGEVISRALSHSRPQRWSAMDYSFLNAIK